MDHLVRYRTSAGETKAEEVQSLEAAVSLVERLRNEDMATDVRVYRQVPIEFKTYYKVVVNDSVNASAPPAEPTGDVPAGAMPLSPSVAGAPAATKDGVKEESDVDGAKRGLFGRN